jgi:cyclopropane-fatty-acyl-phospholipid synthase
MWFDQLFSQRIRQGSLQLEFADGTSYRYGSGQPLALWRLASPRVLRKIVSDPGFMLGQTYMDGGWSTPPGGLLPLLEVLMRNFPLHDVGTANNFLRRLLLPLQQWNRARASRYNVSRHYDLDETMFRQFLDADMHYSCAYFASPEMTLEQAQQAKCELLLRKLRLSPGQQVLDIGCGWGGLAMYLAEHADVRVTGLTLSREQHRVAEQRIRERGLKGRVRVLLEDYREHEGQYDRIVSVGMFEHVGAPFFQPYFALVRERLQPKGVAVVHTIGRYSPPGLTNAWTRRYIFPGGYIPAMSETMAAVEHSGLICSDVEVLRKHYAFTLQEWSRRFEQVRPEWVRQRGEEFCRMWEFYLATSAGSFLWRDLVVFQFQLCRSLDALPITRDYLYRDPFESVQRELLRVAQRPA